MGLCHQMCKRGHHLYLEKILRRLADLGEMYTESIKSQ